MSSFENAALLGLIALLPLVVLTLTSFVKLSVVLSLVRNAIGAPDAPSGLVITGLSLVLTFFVMAPVAVEMANAASAPAPAVVPAPAVAPAPAAVPGPGSGGESGPGNGAAATSGGRDLDAAMRALVPAEYAPKVAAAERALEPLRAFLFKHARQADRETFGQLAASMGNHVRGNEIWVLAPAFIATELREAFLIAVLIFVPFMVIDLVVALSLASLGLTSTSPQTIALPLKLVLFVAVDGWRLLLDGLLRGYL